MTPADHISPSDLGGRTKGRGSVLGWAISLLAHAMMISWLWYAAPPRPRSIDTKQDRPGHWQLAPWTPGIALSHQLKKWHTNMKFSVPGIGAVLFCISVTAHAAASADASAATAADKFVRALQHQHFTDAAAMFPPSQAHNSFATERTLKAIDESLGGLSTMHPIPTLPDGKSIQVVVPAQNTIVPNIQKSLQFCYASTASDGQPVFYALNLRADDTVPALLSFAVHLPTSDAQSTARANRLMRRISRQAGYAPISAYREAMDTTRDNVNEEIMHNQITAVILDDETISIDGHVLADNAALTDALRSALQRDPHVIVVIEAATSGHYRGIGKVIYGSQRVGVPVENLRYTTEDGAIVTFDELRARHPAPPAD